MIIEAKTISYKAVYFFHENWLFQDVEFLGRRAQKTYLCFGKKTAKNVWCLLTPTIRNANYMGDIGRIGMTPGVLES